MDFRSRALGFSELVKVASKFSLGPYLGPMFGTTVKDTYGLLHSSLGESSRRSINSETSLPKNRYIQSEFLKHVISLFTKGQGLMMEHQKRSTLKGAIYGNPFHHFQSDYYFFFFQK